jgi:hypothetical protein
MNSEAKNAGSLQTATKQGFSKSRKAGHQQF